MSRWIAATFVVVALTALLWQMRPSPRLHGAPSLPRVAWARRAPTVAGLLGAATTLSDVAADGVPGKLSKRSSEYIERVDELYPRRLYGAAAQCYEGGIQRDYKMRFAYQLRGVAGEVRVAKVELLYSNFEDTQLETCMRDAILATHWHDDQMPDFSDEDELLVRVRGVEKYLHPDDDVVDDHDGHDEAP